MKTDRKITRARDERGNALFLILIAVALFAALSYAITQSGRGGGTVTKETDMVSAGQVSEEPAAIRTAVTRMIIQGVAPASIVFTSAATVNDVFDQTGVGGGAVDIPPPAGACVTTPCAAWTYKPAASTSSGSYIFGVGTASTEALAYVANITQSICTAINKGLGFTTTPPVLQLVAAYTGVAGAYAAGGSATTIKGAGTTIDGQAFACWQNSVAADQTKNTYYHAIIEQ